MKLTLVTRSIVTAAAVATAVLSYWIGAHRVHAPSALAAVMHGERLAVARTVSPREASASMPTAPARNASARAVTGHAASAPAASASAGEAGLTLRERLTSLRAPLSPESANDPFSVLSWLPPPPPPPPTPAPAPVQEAPPSAPPLPFAYVGTLNRGAGTPQVFLSSGERLLIVSPGEVIDGQYRFESIAATGAVFTYLPLNEKQMISIQGEGK
jgi:hypothetical protein